MFRWTLPTRPERRREPSADCGVASEACWCRLICGTLNPGYVLSVHDSPSVSCCCFRISKPASSLFDLTGGMKGRWMLVERKMSRKTHPATRHPAHALAGMEISVWPTACSRPAQQVESNNAALSALLKRSLSRIITHQPSRLALLFQASPAWCVCLTPALCPTSVH